MLVVAVAVITLAHLALAVLVVVAGVLLSIKLA